MSDKEQILVTIAEYGSSVSKDLFGVKIGVAGKSLIKMGLNNMIKKNPYKTLCDFMFDEDGMLPDRGDFFTAMKEIISQKPLEIAGVKFGVNDIDEIEKIFNKIQ